MGDFQEAGYGVVGVEKLLPQIAVLRRAAFEVFDLFSTQSGGARITDDQGVIDFIATNQPLQFQAVKHLWNLPQLFAFAGNPAFTDSLKELGLRFPNLEVAPLLRCDLPVVGQSIFFQHQDYSYNIGSDNSVTIWLPLQDVTEEMGALLVAPGTHRNGVYPNVKGIITSEHQFSFKSVPVKLGEALIFNQKLVHQSGRNVSDKIRFSVQLRFTDLGCNSYIGRGYPINHKVTTERYEGEIVAPTAPP